MYPQAFCRCSLDRRFIPLGLCRKVGFDVSEQELKKWQEKTGNSAETTGILTLTEDGKEDDKIETLKEERALQLAQLYSIILPLIKFYAPSFFCLWTGCLLFVGDNFDEEKQKFC